MNKQITKAHLTSWGSALGLIGYGIYELVTKQPTGMQDILTGIGLIAASIAGGL